MQCGADVGALHPGPHPVGVGGRGDAAEEGEVVEPLVGPRLGEGVGRAKEEFAVGHEAPRVVRGEGRSGAVTAEDVRVEDGGDPRPEERAVLRGDVRLAPALRFEAGPFPPQPGLDRGAAPVVERG